MTLMTANLTGRAVLVTGGASGIGLATCERFAGCGAGVALNHLPGDPAGPREVARLKAAGFNVAAAPGNVSVPADIDGIVDAAIAAFGRLDWLVNNAGMPLSPDPVPFEQLDALTEEGWAAVLSTNLIGTFRCARAAIVAAARHEETVPCPARFPRPAPPVASNSRTRRWSF